MTSPASPQTPQTQAGFTDPLRLKALELRTRMQAGEKIPIEDLRAFILAADSDLSAQRKKENLKEKASDVEFF